ncbi:MAG: sulfatase [Pirellulaceae bacterium]|nr:sulfatase [Pirellulaceae bacterium]
MIGLLDCRFVPLLLFGCLLVQSAAADQPNVLIILADDLGWADLGFQGSTDIRSPHIDQLASHAIRFTDGHVTASVCSPSRAALMTGKYQQRFGHEANTPPSDHGMDVDQSTMADAMKQLGYRTGVIGKWHLGDRDEFYPTRRGFDYFFGLREGSRSYFYNAKKDDRASSYKKIEENGQQVAFDGYLTDVLGDKAVEFVESDSQDPFFLFLSFTAPHGPMQATEHDLARFETIADKKRRTYAAMIWAMDRAIGRVLDALQSRGQADNTIVWFLSDNGGATNNGSVNLPLAGHKGIKFEGGIRVPFLMRWPKQFGGNTKYDSMVSAMDIFATSFAAAGGDVSTLQLDGVNLLPHLRNEVTTPPHEELYWHKLWFSAMRDGPWKLIYVQDYGYALYNLAEDLDESNNLAAADPQRVESMKERMNAWKKNMEPPRWGEAEVWFRTHSKNHIRIIEGTQ